MFQFIAVPEPVAFYPLNANYKAEEIENRQPDGILGDVAITNGPYNEPCGAYMFYGTNSSYIEFPHIRAGLDSQNSFTLMCWVQPGGQDGPLLGDVSLRRRIGMWIEYGKFFIGLGVFYSTKMTHISTAEVLPTGTWVHVAASYDYNTGYISLFVKGHLRASINITSIYYNPVLTSRIRMGALTSRIRMWDRRGRSNRFKGKIAEMKIFDVPLNEAQIQTSIRQGSCIFHVIVVSLHSLIIPLIIEAPVIGQPCMR